VAASEQNPLDCVLGLGSNLGNRAGYLRGAVAQLQLHAQITAVSALYETDPLGPQQPDYLNAAVRLTTRLAPHPLLELLLNIERAAGRERLERWGPRTLDLDLLFISGRAVEEPGLVVPHRELTRRAFALLPLLDVMPEARDPVTGDLYRELAKQLDRTGVRELSNSRAGWLE
jgi:2-amino-4-hydroxy-6-hydroxymethyldihydropteridine diphosphokinase